MAVDGWLYDQITAGGFKKIGRNPTDLGKQGVKRSLMTDANGLPLALAVAGANTHDIKLVADHFRRADPAESSACAWIKGMKQDGWKRI